MMQLGRPNGGFVKCTTGHRIRLFFPAIGRTHPPIAGECVDTGTGQPVGGSHRPL
jgi:hypothetical protein